MALNPGSGDDGGLYLKERYRIHAEEPLSALDALPARAFAASDLRDAGRRPN